jgi:folate-binding Fe-S cluster repair protein YgfZ
MPSSRSTAKTMNAEEQASFDCQYAAMHSGRGFVVLDDWSSLRITGADRQKFLNNFSTNDVQRLAPGESCEAFFCDVKGRVIGHGLVTCRENSLVVIGVSGQGKTLAEHLDRYVIRDDVQVHDATGEFAYLLVSGDAARSAFDCRWRFAWPLIDVAGACLLESSASDLKSLTEKLAASGLLACKPGVFHTLRIEAGTPLFGVDFDDHNFPQEIGRNAQAISFTKGCYLG